MLSSIKFYAAAQILLTVGMLPVFAAPQAAPGKAPPRDGGPCDGYAYPGDWVCGRVFGDSRAQYLCGNDNIFWKAGYCAGDGNFCIPHDMNGKYYVTKDGNNGAMCMNEHAAGNADHPPHPFVY